MGSEPETVDDYGLAAALANNPEAKVTAITTEGQFCPMPPELSGTHEVLPGDSVFDLVPQSEWGSIGAGWIRVLQHGSYVGSALTNEGDRVSLLTYDARERFGVVIMLMVAGATLGDESTDEALPVVARFGTYHRDVLAVVTDLDEGAEGLLGWTAEDLAEKPANDFIHPDDQANGLENWLMTLAEPGVAHRWRGRHRHKDGDYRWIEFTNTNRMDEAGYVVSEMMDVSEEMATAEELRKQKELLDRLNDALPLGVCQIDGDWNLVYANNQLYELVDRSPDDGLTGVLSELAEGDRDRLEAGVRALLADGSDQSLEVHFCRSGSMARTCLVNLRALRDAEGVVSGAVMAVSDITEATLLRRELEIRATIDPLTGCHNRAATMTALDQAMVDGGRRGRNGARGTAVIFIDLDKFKPVNDELGHAAGDELLVTLASRLRRLVRDDDIVGRVGGDEFLVVCPGIGGAEAALPIARRISRELRTPVTLEGTLVTIGASVGVAWTDAPEATPDSLVAAADEAMYRSKRDGRSEVVLAG